MERQSLSVSAYYKWLSHFSDEYLKEIYNQKISLEDPTENDKSALEAVKILLIAKGYLF